MKHYRTIIVGGGAAGMMAAIVSARRMDGQTRQGRPLLLIEKNRILGRKILVTGNGRCNLTNTHITPDNYRGENTRCLHTLFNIFSSKDTMDFFEQLGVRLKTEEAGRVFPVTNQASTIVDVMVEELEGHEVCVNLEERLTGLNRLEDGWEVKTDKETYRADKIVLTVGGKSYPQLGTAGDGYEVCRRLGHTVIEPRPALVPLELEGSWFHKLQGVKSDVGLSLRVNNKVIREETGELLFTHYGISGPIVLDLSRSIMDYRDREGSSFKVNFFPGYDAESVAGLLADRFRAHPQRTLNGSFLGLLPKKLCSVLIHELKLPGEAKVAGISKKDLQSIADQLAGWDLSVKGTRPFTESMVTAGGVKMDEVNVKTMESLKAKGLYLAGEILDIDGVSGGYNLQFAWSTGAVAGMNQ